VAASLDIETPHGVARAHLEEVQGQAVGALVLGHGAAGGVGACDLVAAADVARSLHVSVALVDQPYRVAGRRSPPPARRLDTAWVAVVDQLRAGPLSGVPFVVGGRSAGARVACRTAAATGAAGVLCLSFPLLSPRGTSRIEELDAVDVPVLVVQGASDRFGMPRDAPPRRTVVQVHGDHRLTSDLDAVRAAVASWLLEIVTQTGGSDRHGAGLP
jgi:predicted alpha/beta-hydrolase family hydrolase